MEAILNETDTLGMPLTDTAGTPSGGGFNLSVNDWSRPINGTVTSPATPNYNDSLEALLLQYTYSQVTEMAYAFQFRCGPPITPFGAADPGAGSLQNDMMAGIRFENQPNVNPGISTAPRLWLEAHDQPWAQWTPLQGNNGNVFSNSSLGGIIKPHKLVGLGKTEYRSQRDYWKNGAAAPSYNLRGIVSVAYPPYVNPYLEGGIVKGFWHLAYKVQFWGIPLRQPL